MTSHWKAILGVVLIFILGFTSGVVCSSIFVHRKMAAFLQHPGAVAEAALEKRLTKHLDLDADQKQKIHAYFMDNQQQRKELTRQIQPQVRALNVATFQQITAVLHPDQQERFRQNVEEFRNRFGKAAASADADNLPPPPSPVANSSVTPAPQH